MKLFCHQYQQPGAQPGKLVDRESEIFNLNLVTFNNTTVTEKNNVSVDECCLLKDTSSVVWIHIQGTADNEALLTLAKELDIH